MFETLEDRQFMSVTPATVGMTDGTSNTVMVGERFCKTDKDKFEPYQAVTMQDVLVSSY